MGTNELIVRPSAEIAGAGQLAPLGRPMGEQVAATLQAAARSPHTERFYRGAIGLFLEYLGEALGVGALASSTTQGRATEWAFVGTAEALRHVRPGHVEGFRAWREAEGDSPNTASGRVAAVVTFLSVAFRDGILTTEQAASMGIRPYHQRQKRDHKPAGRRLTKGEVKALQAAPDMATNKGKRDRALLDTMLYAGLRCEEVAHLTMDDLRQDRGRWWLVLAGKGSKTRKLKLADPLYESLAAWLAVTGRAPGQGTGAIFVSVNKGDNLGELALTTSAINQMVALYGAQAGLSPENGPNRLSPHDLRRTCGRTAYDNGAPLPLIQQMYGHANIATTMQYLGIQEGDGGGAVDFVNYDAVGK